MAKRRGNDEGTVYYSESEGCWFAQLPADVNGKRPKRRAKTQKEALAKLREMEQARSQGVNLSAKRLKVDELLDAWLEEEVRRTVEESTHESYEQICKLYIRPTFGKRWANDIATPELQGWVNTLSDRYSVNVVRNAYARFRAALDAALRWGKLTRNPAIGVKLPRPDDEGKPPPIAGHIQTWLDATIEHRLGVLYLMATLLGLRIGELIGLSWRHYNKEASTLMIEQQIQPIRNKLKASKPKGKRTRLLPVTLVLSDRLAGQWELLQRERGGDEWHEHGLIFPSEIGTPLSPSNVNRHLRDNLKAMELPHWSMHSFRHFQATRLTELGVSEHVIAAILGHKPGRNITRRYAHVTAEAMRQALQMLESDLLRRAA